MGYYKKNQKLFLDNYKSLMKLLYKTLLIFGLSTVAIISVFDGDANLGDTSNSKVRVVARWKRSDQGASSGLPYTDFRNSSSKSGENFWQSIQPSFKCPGSLLRKVGDVGDAGKWMCGMETLGNLVQKEGAPEPCTAYSTGSKENSFFEVEVMSLTKCLVYAYEPSAAIVDHPLRYFEDRVHLESVLIGGKDTADMMTFKTLLEKNGGEQYVDILKLDVWKAEDEIEALEKILEDFNGEESLPIGQLLVRLNVENWKEAPRIGERIVSVFEGLENKGLRMFHKEINEFHKETLADFSFVNLGSLDRFLDAKSLEKLQKN